MRARLEAIFAGFVFSLAMIALAYGQNNPAPNGRPNFIIPQTAPVIASGGCPTGQSLSASASWGGGSIAFQITLGSAGCGSTITLTLPKVPTDWVCDAHNITNPASNVLDETGAVSNTTVVLTNYVRTTGVAGNFTASDVLRVKCLPY